MDVHRAGVEKKLPHGEAFGGHAAGSGEGGAEEGGETGEEPVGENAKVGRVVSKPPFAHLEPTAGCWISAGVRMFREGRERFSPA